jgi:hypothetical protein
MTKLPKKNEKPRRFLVDLGEMTRTVRDMAESEDRPVSSQVRRLVRIALTKLAEDEKRK